MPKKILIVDDEAPIRNLLRHFLKKRGFETSEAGNGTEALEKARKEKPDLVFLDIYLPEVSGLEVLKQIKKELPDIFVIMLSGSQEEALARQSIQFGAYDYIAKPFDLERLQNDFLDRIFEPDK